ncbi:MAG: hypothetical protein QM820_03655 [Minicystis sp.]
MVSELPPVKYEGHAAPFTTCQPSGPSAGHRGAYVYVRAPEASFFDSRVIDAPAEKSLIFVEYMVPGSAPTSPTTVCWSAPPSTVYVATCTRLTSRNWGFW